MALLITADGTFSNRKWFCFLPPNKNFFNSAVISLAAFIKTIILSIEKFILKEINTMRIRLSITAHRDIWLLTLYYAPDFDFKGWLKDSLRTFCETGRTIRAPLPDIPADLKMKKVMLSLTLDEQKDWAIIKWLGTMKKELWAPRIKCVLQYCLDYPCWFYCFKDPAFMIAKWKEWKNRNNKIE